MVTQVLISGLILMPLLKERILNGGHEVERAHDGDEVEVNPRSVSPVPDVVEGDGRHLLVLGILHQPLLGVLDSVGEPGLVFTPLVMNNDVDVV